MTEHASQNSAAAYAAAQQDAAVFNLHDRAQIELTGADRAKFLHNFCTNDIRSLQPGNGCEAFLTNVQGKVLAHVFVFSDQESLWLESVPGSSERIVSHLSRYQINEDVTFHDRSAELSSLFLSGPEAANVLLRVGIDVGSLQPLQHRWSESLGFPVHIRRNDLLGGTGFILVAKREQLGQLRQSLPDSGAKPAEQNVFDALRIEALTPVFGQDIIDANLAPEVGRNRQAISYTKGCYLGQEPIARIDALGHINQELRGIRFDGNGMPALGSEVLTTEGEPRVIGQVMSAAISFGDNRVVALAYLKRNFNAAGTRVQVLCNQGLELGTVFQKEPE